MAKCTITLEDAPHPDDGSPAVSAMVEFEPEIDDETLKEYGATNAQAVAAIIMKGMQSFVDGAAEILKSKEEEASSRPG